MVKTKQPKKGHRKSLLGCKHRKRNNRGKKWNELLMHKSVKTP